MRYILLLCMLLSIIPATSQAGGAFLLLGAGVGVYDSGAADPDITTPNPLGRLAIGGGYDFGNGFDVRIEAEHWSSLEGFPRVWDSPNEDGYGFNGAWLKAEKRFYIKK